MTDEMRQWWNSSLNESTRNAWLDCYQGNGTLLPDLFNTLPVGKGPGREVEAGEGRWVWVGAAYWKNEPHTFSISYHLSEDFKDFLHQRLAE